jgi:imidazolonepropionase-like amidohydrolase
MMYASRLWLAAVFMVMTASCAALEPARSDLIRIKDVAIVDVGSGITVPDQDVFIRGARIEWVGPAGSSALADAGLEIQGRGLFLMPGLWDSHVHVFSAQGEPDFALELYILNGVTSIRDMGALISLDAQMEVNAEIESGGRVGPRIINAGALIDGPPGSWPGQMVAATPQEGRARVREAAALGWTSVKAYSLLDRETYFAIAEEAEALGLPLYGHVPEGVILADAIAAGHDVIEHFGRVTKACSTEEREMIDGARAALTSDDPFQALMFEMATHTMTSFETWNAPLCEETVRKIADAGIAVAPTLMVSDYYLGKDPPADDPRMQTVPSAVRAHWGETDFRRAAMTPEMLAIAPAAVRQDWETFKLAHEAGVTMLASSDAAFLNPFLFHGATLLDELERYVEIGLTPQAALATATLNPARLFGEGGETGRIEAGQRADMILLRGNPLADISSVRELEMVVAAGRVFDRVQLNVSEAKLREKATTVIELAD